jgi:hypothetical protein
MSATGDIIYLEVEPAGRKGYAESKRVKNMAKSEQGRHGAQRKTEKNPAKGRDSFSFYRKQLKTTLGKGGPVCR